MAAQGELAGRIALISGAASGIGRAIAELFLQEGASVVLADINGELLTATAEALAETATARVRTVVIPRACCARPRRRR